MEDNTLHLVLKKQWYDLIESGIKKEEYREIKPYWIKRLWYNPTFDRNGHVIEKKPITDWVINVCKERNIDLIEMAHKGNMLPKDFNNVCFHFGYTNTKMTFQIKSITVDTGKEEWGAEKDKLYFVIKLGVKLS